MSGDPKKFPDATLALFEILAPPARNNAVRNVDVTKIDCCIQQIVFQIINHHFFIVYYPYRLPLKRFGSKFARVGD